MQRFTLSQFEVVSSMESFVKLHVLIMNLGEILHFRACFFLHGMSYGVIVFIISLPQPDRLVIVRNLYCGTWFLFLGLIPKPSSIALLVKANPDIGKKPGHEKSENSGSTRSWEQGRARWQVTRWL